MDFQQFVEERIGVGKAQYFALIALALVEMADGMQAIIVSLVTPILKQELSLNQSQVSFLTAIFYVGVAVGALEAGIQANSQGRRKALILGVCIQIISGLLLSIRVNYAWFCCFRFLYGFGFGSTLAVATLIATQFMPVKLRGRTLLIINFMNSIGKLIGVCLAFIFIKDQQSNWPQYIVSSLFLSLVSFILILLHVRQSFRYLISKQRLSQAIVVIDQMIAKNHPGIQNAISENQRQELTRWGQLTFAKKYQNNNTINILLSDYKIMTLLLCLSWFCVAFVFFGEMLIVPFMMNQHKEMGLIQYLWMTMGELPSIMLTFYLIEKEYCGRRRSLVAFFSLCSLFCLFAAYSISSFSLFFTKLFMKASFQMLYPLTAQSYATTVRSIGFALSSIAGRIGSTIMPFIVYASYNRDKDSPFLIFSAVSIVGALSIWFIKTDTYLRPLDDISEGKASPEPQNKELVQEN